MKNQTLKAPLTHGEAWYIWKCHINSMNTKFEEIFNKPPRGSKRMSRADASRYYNKKARDVFTALGMIKKVKPIVKSEFEIRLPSEVERVKLITKRMLKKEVRKNNRLYLGMVQ